MPTTLLDGFSKRAAEIDGALAAKVADFRNPAGTRPDRVGARSTHVRGGVRHASAPSPISRAAQPQPQVGGRRRSGADGTPAGSSRNSMPADRSQRLIPDRDLATVDDVVACCRRQWIVWNRGIDVLRAV